MLSALADFDFRVLEKAVSLTNQCDWLRLIAYFSAEFLILFFPFLLFMLWQWPEAQSRHHGSRKAVVLASVSVAVALALKSLISFAWGRERPFIAHPELLVLNLKVDPVSFPSGHTLIAFTIACSLLFSGYRKIGALALFLAFMVGLSRVLLGVHYPFDVLAGAFIGVIVAWGLHRESSSLKRYLPDH